jgi:hypothetical protein
LETEGHGGAEYIPLVEIVPNPALPPGIPLTIHCTEVFGAPLTVAENCWFRPPGTLTEVGDTTTEVLDPEVEPTLKLREDL